MKRCVFRGRAREKRLLLPFSRLYLNFKQFHAMYNMFGRIYFLKFADIFIHD